MLIYLLLPLDHRMEAAEIDVQRELDRRFGNNLVRAFEWKGLSTFVPNKTLPIHNWFLCPQAYSGLLVGRVLERFHGKPGEHMVDPFGGVGTTALVGKAQGYRTRSIELFPVFCLVPRTPFGTSSGTGSRSWGVKPMKPSFRCGGPTAPCPVGPTALSGSSSRRWWRCLA